MALSSDAKKLLIIAMANKRLANEVSAAIDDVDGRVAATVAAVSTADGSDAATTQALANALKTKVNAILTALKAAGLMDS